MTYSGLTELNVENISEWKSQSKSWLKYNKNFFKRKWDIVTYIKEVIVRITQNWWKNKKELIKNNSHKHSKCLEKQNPIAKSWKHQKDKKCTLPLEY